MPPQSRGNAIPVGFQSKSTPNLPTLRSLDTFASVSDRNVARQEPARGTSSRSPGLSHSPLELGATGNNAQEGVEQFILNPSSSSESEDSEDDALPTARPLYASRSQTHLSPHTTSTLFPPFYNRPPTPLPPSPSLTSLLRPSFSTQNSRPTTPDSSDVDLPSSGTAAGGGNTSTTSNLASITKSARHAPTVPRASPKVPTYEYYGFALYLASSAAFLMYILWAYVPSPLLHQMGIHYYPNRWWALAVPAWMVVTVLFIYVALASYNTQYLTLPMSSCENLVDECAQVAVIDKRTGKIIRKDRKSSARASRSNSLSSYQYSISEDVDWKRLWSTGTDAVMDVPIGGVCEILYGRGRDDEG
ncbi:PIG-P-domain-containing protein [Lojkania enalia]|uniref:PIG-P-domain-containing protein n=1 Tax=Lojkania enalia TaxID=147567 RepID=A0A9P4N6X2_9PLEO|nr:PIG-P-domain-containing protein [Didymosphaeria enalia]